MPDECQALIAKFKAAYEASPTKLTVMRSVLRVGAGSNYTFRRTEAFDRWSDLDGRSAETILIKHFGEQEAARLIETLQRAIVRQDTRSSRCGVPI